MRNIYSVMIKILPCLMLLIFSVTDYAQTTLKAKISIDSTVIHTPNAQVIVNANACIGRITLTQWLQLSGPTRAYWKHGKHNDMIIYKLIPGRYKFQLFVNNDKEDTASAFVNVTVLPAKHK